ncbi:hypothetical protein CfE428DRAFT_6297 [Chthoniobacter flavus Ellin428]|uniref:Uncharacterized protein n=2 Tax=Chthoniobacter flavus TaxID=191863 RepID=B4DBK6_9BACT|nr:hypothetical protein CfE428DRAFT_6297 [Chthoniobacter flavus Ellin428]
MRLLTFMLFALLGSLAVHAGSIETFNGEVLTGKTELDFGGVVFRPEKGPVVKMDLGSIYRVQFDGAPAQEMFTPGVVLRSGVRLAAPWGPFNDPVVKFPKRNLSLSADEIAWIIYTPFPVELAPVSPAGKPAYCCPRAISFPAPSKVRTSRW